jgi:hypothetical protein
MLRGSAGASALDDVDVGSGVYGLRARGQRERQAAQQDLQTAYGLGWFHLLPVFTLARQNS